MTRVRRKLLSYFLDSTWSLTRIIFFFVNNKYVKSLFPSSRGFEDSLFFLYPTTEKVQLYKAAFQLSSSLLFFSLNLKEDKLWNYLFSCSAYLPMRALVWLTLENASFCASRDFNLLVSHDGSNKECCKGTTRCLSKAKGDQKNPLFYCSWLASLAVTDGGHFHQQTHDARNSRASFSKTLGLRAA